MKQARNKQYGTTVWLSKPSAATLKRISDLSRIPISKLLKDYAEQLQIILDRCPEETDRITIASYANSKTKKVETLLAPLLSGSWDVPSVFTDEDVSLSIHSDIERKTIDLKKKKVSKK